MFNKKILAGIAFAGTAFASLALGPGEAPFSYNKTNEQKNPYGYGRKETLSVAINLSGKELEGKKILGVRVPFNTVEYFSGLSGWTTTTLDIEGKENKPNGAVATADIVANAYNEIRFDEPYVIPEGGCYAGYSFTIDEITNSAYSPILLISSKNDGAFYLHGSYSQRKWSDQSGLGTSAMEVILGGLEENALGVKSVVCSASGVNSPVQAILTVSNHGTSPVHDFEYEYTVDGKTYTGKVEIPEETEGKTIYSSPFYATTYNTTIMLPAFEDADTYPMQMKITKVNGVDNTDEMASCDTDVRIVGRVAYKRPVVEEYTGTWCQYCIRGYAGMEYMTHNFEDFIGIVYHNQDPMEVLVSTQFPEGGGGFPYARFDRTKDVDAFYGDQPSSSYKFGLDAAWLERRHNTYCPADIDVKVEWNDDETELNITSTVNFVKDENSKIYRIAYALLQDEMTGNGASWAQHNGYSGNTSFYNHPLMDEYARAAGSINGLVFNDVYMGGSETGGIANSLPYDIKKDTPYEHSYTIKLADIKGTRTNPIIQDKKKLKVVALLISSRKIINGAKAFVPGYDGELANVKGDRLNDNGEAYWMEVQPEYVPPVDPETGVEDILNDADAAVEGIYDLNGRRVENPSEGIYIFRLSNGKTVKRVIR